jgi:hypothetical protein
MYIRTSGNLGQVQSPSVYKTPCWQDNLPNVFINFRKHIVDKTLDGFVFRKFSLTPRHASWINNQFVPQIIQSWQTNAPIRTIILIGHTDELGDQTFNYNLGLNRAKAVRQSIFKEIDERQKGLVGKIKIVTFSRGECWPTIKGGKRDRRNRRVEVYAFSSVPASATGYTPPPSPTQKSPIDLHHLPEDIRKKIEEETAWQRYLTKPIPTLPEGKSIKDWFDEIMSRYKVPKFLRNKIWEAISGKDNSVLSKLLDQAGIPDGLKKSIVGLISAGSQVKVR